MEKIQIKDQLREEYKQLILTAQNIEAAVGSSFCKLQKMVEVRRNIDLDLKKWWEGVADEYKIDKSKDYFVDSDGAINLVEKQDKQPKPDQGDNDAPVEPVAQEEAPAVVEAPPTEGDNKEGGTTADLT